MSQETETYWKLTLLPAVKALRAPLSRTSPLHFQYSRKNKSGRGADAGTYVRAEGGRKKEFVCQKIDKKRDMKKI